MQIVRWHFFRDRDWYVYKSAEKTSSSTRIRHNTICCGVDFTNLLADIIIESYLGVVKKAKKGRNGLNLHTMGLFISVPYHEPVFIMVQFTQYIAQTNRFIYFCKITPTSTLCSTTAHKNESNKSQQSLNKWNVRSKQ